MPGRKLTVTLFGVNRLSATLQRGLKDVKRFSVGARAAGRTMTTSLTAPIALFGFSMIKTAAGFEASMKRVQGVSGAVGTDLKKLTELAKEQGNTTQFTASQAADAQLELAKAGFDANQIMTLLPQTLQLAAASNMGLAEATEIATGQLKAYGFEAEEMQRVNDALTNTNIRTKTDLVSLSDSLREVAPLAKQMGIEFEELAAAAGLMGDNVIEGGKGGVALKTILGNLAAPSKEAQKVLKKLGIPRAAIVDSKGNVKSLIAVVEELEKAGAGSAEFFQIFGKRGALGIAALVGTGSEKFKELLGELKDPGSVGETFRQAELRMEGAQGAMNAFVAGFQGFMLSIGDSGILEDFTSLTFSVADFFRGLSKTNPLILKWGTYIALGVAVIGPLVVGIGLFASAVVTMVPIVAGGLAAIGVVFGVITGPIGLFVAAIGLLGLAAYGLVDDWAPVGAFFSDLWGSITSGYDSAIDALPDFIKTRLGIESGAAASAPATGGAAEAAQAVVSGLIGISVSDDRVRVSADADAMANLDFGPSTGPILQGI